MLSVHLSLLDSFIVVAYFLVTIALGVWFGRKRIRSADDLFLADREATWPLIGASLFSANISSQQFVGQAGLAYAIGLAAGAFQLEGAMAFVFLAVFFIDVYLSLGLRTAPEFFERRYNTGSRVFISAINIATILAGGITPSLYAGGIVLSGLFVHGAGLGFGAAVAIIAAAAGTYTILGGLRSVLWTDLLQAGLLVCGGIVTFVVTLSRAGGWAAVLATHDATGMSRWTVIQPWDHPFGWLPLLTGGMVLAIRGHCTDQDYVQRALSARSVYHSKMGVLFGGFLKVSALFIVAAPGVIAAQLLPGLAHPDDAYARLVSTYVPTGLAGLVLAGLLAAILGTVAAGLSGAASLLSYDFVQRFRPGISNRGRILIGRILMGASLGLCTLLAPGIRDYPSLFDYLVELWSLAAPPVFICVVAGVFTRRATARGAVATLLTGIVLGAAGFWLLGQPTLLATLPVYLRNSLNLGFVITVICAGVMLLFSSGRKRPPAIRAERSLHRQPAPSMSLHERRIYRFTLTTLLVVWMVATLTFSPWGLARSRPTGPPTVVRHQPGG